MKKFVFLLLVFLTLNTALFSQEAPVVEASSTESDLIDFQGEVLRWEEVPRAKKYQVSIEKLQDDGSWKKTKSYTTTKNFYNANLDPGEYRVSISTFNVLGKKSSTSEWVEFLVLGNQTPYIYYEYFNKVAKYKSPVLFIDKNNKDRTKNADYKNYLIPASGQPENSFTIKGRNIFYSSTKFYLVPVDKSLNGGEEYGITSKNRQTVELSVLNKNSRTYKLNLQYDSTKLSSGYYNLEAVNPDGSKYDVSILVIADEEIKIIPDKFDIDERYGVRRLDIQKSGETIVNIIAQGISEDTKYYLRPTENVIGYPFNSQLELEKVYGSVTSIKPRDDAGFDVVVSFNVENLRTSYYTFYAQKDFTQTDSFDLLIVRPFLTDSEHKEKVEKIKTKLKKRTTNVTFTVEGKKLEDASAINLVSEYQDAISGNSKLKVNLEKDKKSGKYKVVFDYNQLNIGHYGLQVDTPDGEFVYTFELNTYLKSNEKNLSNEEFLNIFFKPLPKVGQNLVDENDGVALVRNLDSVVSVVKHIPIFVPYSYFYLGYIPELENYIDVQGNSFMPFNFSAELDVLNVGYFTISPGMKANLNAYSRWGLPTLYYPDLTVNIFSKFIAPGKYFAPYVGVGAGIHIFEFGELNPWVKFDFADFESRNNYYFAGKAGVVLFSFLDFVYTLEWHNSFNRDAQYFRDYISFGFRMPVNPPYYSTKYSNRHIEIDGKASITGTELNIVNGETGIITFKDKVQEITGFSKLSSVHTIRFGKGLTVIGPECFADCKNLANISFDYSPEFTKICKGAFRNDKEIEVIRIPYTVTTIEADAFAGWTKDQEIVLVWTPDDVVSRNLEGLKNVNCKVSYINGTPYKGGK